MPKLNKPLVRLHFCGLVFTPKLIPTVVSLLILPVLLSLGTWQLRRANYKKQLEQQFALHKSQAPLTLNQLPNDLTQVQYYRIKVSGQFDNNHQFLVDNRVVKHRVGYEVLTPLIIKSIRNKVILVNRGWIPRGNSRNVLPKISPIKGYLTITGKIKLPPSRVFVLSHKVGPTSWPLRIQAIDLSKISKALHKTVYPFLILLSPQNTHGFVRNWRATTMKSYKHQGYAVQWFLLALTLVVIYLIVNTRRVTKKR